jgi:chromate transport protein ChrA
MEVFDKYSDKTKAKLAGVFILTAYLMLLNEAIDNNIFGLSMEVISGLSVIGIAVILYPYFAKVSKNVSAAYLVSRIVEGVLMIISGLLILAGNLDGRNYIYENIHIYAFIAGAAFMYWLFEKSKLIPRFIAVWGYIAVFFLSLTTILGWFSIENQGLQSLLILMITNEIFLAAWLMTKGLNINKSQSAN